MVGLWHLQSLSLALATQTHHELGNFEEGSPEQGIWWLITINVYGMFITEFFL